MSGQQRPLFCTFGDWGNEKFFRIRSLYCCLKNIVKTFFLMLAYNLWSVSDGSLMRPHVQSSKAKVSSGITAVTSVMVGSNYTAPLLCCSALIPVSKRMPWIGRVHWPGSPGCPLETWLTGLISTPYSTFFSFLSFFLLASTVDTRYKMLTVRLLGSQPIFMFQKSCHIKITIQNISKVTNYNIRGHTFFFFEYFFLNQIFKICCIFRMRHCKTHEMWVQWSNAFV